MPEPQVVIPIALSALAVGIVFVRALRDSAGDDRRIKAVLDERLKAEKELRQVETDALCDRLTIVERECKEASTEAAKRLVEVEALKLDISRLERDKAHREVVSGVLDAVRALKDDVNASIAHLKSDLEKRFDRLEQRNHMDAE